MTASPASSSAATTGPAPGPIDERGRGRLSPWSLAASAQREMALPLRRQPRDVRADRQLQDRPGACPGHPGAARAMSGGAMILSFGGSAYRSRLAPLLPWWAIAALGGAAVLALGLGLWRRARGTAWRALALAMLLAILANPSLVEEKRSALRDVAVVVVDELPSQQIGERRTGDRGGAATALQERLGPCPRSRCPRSIRAGEAQPGSGDDGTRLFTALSRRMSDVPRAAAGGGRHDHRRPGARRAGRRGRSRRAGAGRAAPRAAAGQPDERDRRLVVAQAPSFGVVGKRDAADDPGRGPAGVAASRAGSEPQARVTWRKDGGAARTLDGAGRARRAAVDPDRPWRRRTCSSWRSSPGRRS